jgi:hypothetical protein
MLASNGNIDTVDEIVEERDTTVQDILYFTKNEIPLYKIYHISRRTRYHCTRYTIFHEERDTTVQNIPYFTKNEIPLYKIYHSGLSFFVKYGISCTVVSRSSWNMVYLVQWYLVLREIWYILYSGLSFFVDHTYYARTIFLFRDIRVLDNKIWPQDIPYFTKNEIPLYKI